MVEEISISQAEDIVSVLENRGEIEDYGLDVPLPSRENEVRVQVEPQRIIDGGNVYRCEFRLPEGREAIAYTEKGDKLYEELTSAGVEV